MPRIALKITILGASGFIGRHLTAHLRKRGDTVIEGRLREATSAAKECEGSDVVVNLAGAPAAARWTAAYKDEIRRSRVDVPRALIEKLGRLPGGTRPKAYISASAVGYYGTSLTATFTEDSAPGNDFLADVCVGWEREATRATAYGMRVAVLRTGIVLGPDGGALKPLMPMFKLGTRRPVRLRQAVDFVDSHRRSSGDLHGGNRRGRGHPQRHRARSGNECELHERAGRRVASSGVPVDARVRAQARLRRRCAHDDRGTESLAGSDARGRLYVQVSAYRRRHGKRGNSSSLICTNGRHCGVLKK